MLTSFSESYKTPLFARSTSEMMVGYLVDMVINPDTGIFEALWINSIDGQKLLLPKDIIYWNAQKILIDDVNNLAKPEELPRLQKTLERECIVLGAWVYAKTLVKPLGKVSDFTFDTISPRLLSLDIKAGWFGLQHRIIPQTQVQKINEKGVWIKQTKSKVQTQKPPLQAKIKDIKNLGEVDIKQKIDKK